MKSFFLILATLLGLSSCGDNSAPKNTSSGHPALKVGVTAGPHAIIMEFVKKEAEKRGLYIEVKEFSDFVLPNKALDASELDLNSYQHLPYLKEQKKLGLKIESVANTVLMPLGIYSQKHKDLNQIKDQAQITIPNDPTNCGRALILLQTANLIKLKNSENPTILDIVDNPHHLKIVEIEAPQLPHSLPDVDFAIINTDWVVASGLDPKSSLLNEDPKSSPYANIIAIKEGQKDRPEIKEFIEIYQSPETKQFILDHFKNAVIPSF